MNMILYFVVKWFIFGAKILTNDNISYQGYRASTLLFVAYFS